MTTTGESRVRRLGHVPALDAFRGIAILMVLVGHMPQPALKNFGLGVDLFFVLSGFLITSLLLNEWSKDGAVSFGGFYRRRALRLLPALMLMMAVLIALTRTRAILEDAGLVFLYLSNLGAMVGHGPGVAGLGHMWSLAQEEQFYLVWPLVLSLALRPRMRPHALLYGLACLFVGICLYRLGLSARGASSERVWYGPDTHADGLVIGCLAAVAYTSGAVRRIPLRTLVAALAAGAICVLTLNSHSAWNISLVLPFFSIAAVLALLSFVLEPHSWLCRSVNHRPLRYFGRVSYGVYLWHLPLYAMLGWKLGILVTLAVAALSYRYVEQPFLRRKRRAAPTINQPLVDVRKSIIGNAAPASG